MLRLKCHKCGKDALTGSLKIINEEQLFECWHCMEKAELERDKKLKTASEEEQIPDMPPSETEERLWLKFQQDKMQELIEEYERARKRAPGDNLVFDPSGPRPPWIVTAENDLVNRQVWTDRSK